MNHGILFWADDEGELQTYADADFAQDTDTRKSVTRLLHKFRSSPIHWSSNLQEIVNNWSGIQTFIWRCQRNLLLLKTTH